MHSVNISGAVTPPPIVLQADRIRRRIAASDSVAVLVADLAFGSSARDDHDRLAALVSHRAGASVGAR